MRLRSSSDTLDRTGLSASIRRVSMRKRPPVFWSTIFRYSDVDGQRALWVQ